MIQFSNWLAFFDLNEMLAGCRPPDVYCLHLTVNETTRVPHSSIGVAQCDLIVSGWDAYHDGLIRYWLMRIGAVNTVNGMPHDPDRHNLMIRRAEAAREFIAGYLRSRGFHPIPAALSMPIGLRLIEGDPDGIDYDETTNTFRWRIVS